MGLSGILGHYFLLTSRKDARTFEMLRSIRYDANYDGHAEGLENLSVALQQVIQPPLRASV